MPPHFSRHPHLARIIIHLFIKSDIAVLAAKQGLLNVSAFARLIQSQVEKTASKKVGVKTIGMTILSRLAIYEIRIVSLSINNGIMSMSVDQDQSGLVLIALRDLVKREQVFS